MLLEDALNISLDRKAEFTTLESGTRGGYVNVIATYDDTYVTLSYVNHNRFTKYIGCWPMSLLLEHWLKYDWSAINPGSGLEHLAHALD